MADVKPPSTKVAVVALRGFWKGPTHIATGQLAWLTRREAREAIASKIVREATQEEAKQGSSAAKGTPEQAEKETAEKEAGAKKSSGSK